MLDERLHIVGANKNDDIQLLCWQILTYYELDEFLPDKAHYKLVHMLTQATVANLKVLAADDWVSISLAPSPKESIDEIDFSLLSLEPKKPTTAVKNKVDMLNRTKELFRLTKIYSDLTKDIAKLAQHPTVQRKLKQANVQLDLPYYMSLETIDADLVKHHKAMEFEKR